MADKQQFVSKPKEEIISVVLNRLSTVSEEPLRDLVAKSLSRRKRKWEMRTKQLTSRDEEAFASVLEEKNGLVNTQGELRGKLMCKRREGIDQTRRLEYKRSLYLHQPLQERLEKIRDDISQHRKKLTNESEESPPASTHPDANILGDLEKAIFQVGELTKAQHMKFFVTPRVPRLDRRREQPHTTTAESSNSSLLPQQDVADAASSSVVGKQTDYLPEDHLPAIAETIETTSEELNFAATTSVRTNTSSLPPEVSEMEEQTEEEKEECIENGLDSVFSTEEILTTSASAEPEKEEEHQNKQTLAEVHLNGTVLGGEELTLSKRAKLSRELHSELSALKEEIEN